MRKFVVGALALAAVLASATACSSSASNPLIGKWKYSGKGYVDGQGTSYCGDVTEMQFTGNSQTRWSPATDAKAASSDTQPVHYIVNGDKVYVESTQAYGSGMYWNFLSKDEIKDDVVSGCVFDRE